MTLDGFCDHTAISPNDEIHQHYADLLSNAGAVLYGRITFQLMKYWQNIVENPTGNQSMDNFALIMDRVPKIVFSHTLKNVEWASAELANLPLAEMVTAFKKQSGGEILVGSRSIIIQLLKLNLIDEFQLCIHPIIAGRGLPLFENIGRTSLKLIKTKNFKGGAVILSYQPEENNQSAQ